MITDPSAATSEPGPTREETLSSRRGYDGALLHIRVDEIRLPSGRRTVREVVEHPGAVAIVALTPDHQVLLLRQYHHAIGRVLLGLPAGTLEPGEEPVATAARELTEETGYAAGRLTELVAYYTSPGYTNERLTIFRADECRRAGNAPDPDELLALATVPLASVPALLADHRIEESKTLIGLLWLLRDHA